MKCRAISTFLSLVSISGWSPHSEGESLHSLASHESANLLEENRVVASIDLDDIKLALIRATWHSGTPIKKGTHHLQIASHPDIYVSYYGEFFMREGQSGYYQIAGEDRLAFREYFSELLQDIIIPRRLEQNKSEQGR